ncbi:RDD family protein [Paenibacillus sp. B2(2019)]|uniref:RDD family protein n=1 Tax=Paenibacillus sp. B2(2019) TaxID=2607754 RepID=UPI0011F0BC96|nr:RDD family protein [Paenibacillus sp. B2(2019)]KAA1183508.1 RDD family protein [Paenibacillus sp. B2(2019)]
MDNNKLEHLEQEDFIGFWKRVLATILDLLVILIPAVIVYMLFNSLAVSLHSEIPIILEYIFFIVFDIFMIVRFGGSPGKLILKMKIINDQGKYPTLKEALVRNIFRIISTIFSMIVGVSLYDLTAISTNLALWAPLANDLSKILAPIMLVDYLFVAFTPRKRALHDIMAGTYVVDKSAI